MISKKRLMLATLLVALSGVCIEVVLRLAGLASNRSLFSVDLASYEQVPGIWEPGQDLIWSHNRALPFSVKTNSSGYRGAEFSRQKKPNEIRVFMVGDSFTFGSNVNESETLPYMLQQELSKSCKNEYFSIINAGIPGSTIKSHAQMIRRGMALQPDIIILVFNETDVDDLAEPLWDQMADNRNTKGRFPLSVVWPVLRDTATWGLVSRLRETAITEQLKEHVEGGSLTEVDHADYKIAYLQQLKNLATEVEASKASFMIATYPGHHAVRDNIPDDTMHWAMQEFRKLGIPEIDLLEPLQQAFSEDIDSAYLLPDDGHPSKLGHQLAGTSIANWLLTRPPLQSLCHSSKT